jgi:hypothetical protein
MPAGTPLANLLPKAPTAVPAAVPAALPAAAAAVPAVAGATQATTGLGGLAPLLMPTSALSALP